MTPWIHLFTLFAIAAWPLALGAAPVVSVPRFTHPGAGHVFYFVLTDRFDNGSTANDTGGHVGGPEDHGFDPSRVSHFHGGDIAGLTRRLDYLREMGITAIWVTPPFKNKEVQQGTAGYHGYWILDFLQVDPHLGTNGEFREFIDQAHERGMRVFMDIIVNHTADVIHFAHDVDYRSAEVFPFRTAEGVPFDVREVVYNGLNSAADFPKLDARTSFAHVPLVPPEEAEAKNPAWLNDVTLYHNRGNTTFEGENAVYGDFVGLDDLFTEHPRVVEGFVEIFGRWIAESGVDGFRIDTARHVNSEFWQAFIPAIRAKARESGRPDFLQFGEVYNDAGDPAVLSEFSTGTVPIDTTLDFGFFAAARKYVSQGGTAAALADFFARDDYYTDHDGNVHATTTFLGNHDAGRFAYFLSEDNPGASRGQLADLVRLGHGLLFLSRGQPVVYYGDEQGMIGRGGNDMQARESMFAAQAPAFRDAALLATSRTGASDKFDPEHPFYRFFGQLARLRAAHAALRTGAMVPRPTAGQALFAFSRIERGERVEYLAVFNNSRVSTLTATVPTSQISGAVLTRIFDSRHAKTVESNAKELRADDLGGVRVSLEPLQFSVWRAVEPLAAAETVDLEVTVVTPVSGAVLGFVVREVDGLVFPSRREIRAEVKNAGGYAEVTFAMTRGSRPGQFELLGVDDTPPYRLFWSPPSDLAPGESISFIASVNDLRGRRASALVDGLTVKTRGTGFGIRGATMPILRSLLPGTVAVQAGETLRLSVEASGTEPLEYQWICNDAEIDGATDATLEIPSASASVGGRYAVLVRNRAGTAVSAAADVTVAAGRSD